MKRLDNGVDRLNLCQLRFAFLISLLIGGESGLAFLKLLLALFKLYLTGCDGGDAFIVCLMSLGELGGVGVIGRLTLFKLRLTGGKLRAAGIIGAETGIVSADTVGIDVGIRGKLRDTGIRSKLARASSRISSQISLQSSSSLTLTPQAQAPTRQTSARIALKILSSTFFIVFILP